jgi:hypothetical protein
LKCKNRNYFHEFRCILIIFSLLPHLLLGQGLFNFEKDSSATPDLCPGGGWEQIPEGRWNCSMERAIEGEFSLKHEFDNPESGCDFLIHSHQQIDPGDSLVLSFRVRHGYTPSSANNWQLALAAEFSHEAQKIQKGIVVGVNYKGSDDTVKIWNVGDGLANEICVSSLNYQEEVGIEEAPVLTLVWYPEGRLKLCFAKDPSQKQIQIGSCELEQLPLGQELVVRYAYTSARDRNLWLDDLHLGGSFTRDSLAPFVRDVLVLGEHSLQVGFSEQIESPKPGSFLLNGKQPDSCLAEGAEVMLTFSDSIPNRLPQWLWLGNICDRDQNCMADTVVGFLRNESLWGDVVFNELMADPDPETLLPAEEYLELFNRSDYTIDLLSWSLHVNHRVYDQLVFYEWRPSGLLEASSQLEPLSYKVIKGVSLPNEGATLALYNDQGVLVHGVSYQLPWEASDWKKEGGWSLESPDPDQLCMVSQWWTYSADPSGGTPGRINSHFFSKEDMEPPVLLYYGHESPETIAITYSEPLNISHLIPSDFLLRPGSVFPAEIKVRQPLSTQLVLSFPSELQERVQFKIDLPSVSDCQGNLSRQESLLGGKIDPPEQGQLFINEIMFNPLDGDPEFVELYNPGPGYFDLRYLSLHVLESGAPPNRPIALSEVSRIFLPDQYLVLTPCVPHLMESYGLDPSGLWLEVENLPVLKNTGGSLYLTDRSGGVVDQVNYSDMQHLDLLTEPKGVSLERISIDRPGIEPENWHSAASIAGYATPGAANSQAASLLAQDKLLEVEPEVFSPDNDGYQDQLSIRISPKSQGWIIRLWISSLSGSLVRSLANNHMAGPSVGYSWDGETDQGRMAMEGIYVVHLLAYYPNSGERWSRKAAIGVIYR